MFYDALPTDLRSLVFDFYGDTSFPRWRKCRFVGAEIIAFGMVARHWGTALRPSLVRSTKGFKEALRIAYLQAERKTVAKDHTGSFIP